MTLSRELLHSAMSKGRILKSSRALFALSLSSFFYACASPKVAAESPASEPEEPAATETTSAEEKPAPEAAPAPRELGERPASIAGFAPSCQEAGALPAQVKCAEPLQSLGAALSQNEVSTRDQALAKLESCQRFSPGLIRALRADLGPVSCADALTLPALNAEPELADSQRDLLIALTYAAWLRRSSASAPAAPDDPNKENIFQLYQCWVFY